ncbi:MAG: AMP-binding protein [Planctomycetota bacterium]|nr:AMP-binding protein [Planctomycetota bacterium]MDA0934259.1 AMP-binding protein [Planctomycetota bacterium]
MLDRAELLWPERTAVVGDTPLTYGELAGIVRWLACDLHARGLRQGDRVAALCENHPRFLALHFAAARLGAILVPFNTRLTTAEHRTVVERAQPTILFADRTFAPAAAELASTHPELEVVWSDGAPGASDDAPRAALVLATDPAQLYFTSGTTGRPKGVVLTHGNVLTHALMAVAELRLDESDTWAHIAPMFHLADAWATFAITAVGGQHAFLPRFDARATLDLFEEHRVTVTNLVPTMLNRVVHEPGAAERDTSSLRLLMSGGAPIAPETVRRVVETFDCEYVQTYGMTETSPYLTFSLLSGSQRRMPPAEQLAARARTGRPVLGVELRVVDGQSRPIPADDTSVGEIQVRGPTVTPGYWQDEEATAAAFTEDGFLHTGDLATIDATGSVRIVDRAKDVILSGGENVYSTEVEYRLQEHPAVLEVAVYAEPDADLGERVAAAVVLRPGVESTAAELIAFCRAELAGFKTPKSVRFLEALPRTGSGKIQKRALRETASD